MQKIESKETWEAFIGSHKEANFLQSWYWGEFQKSIGKEVEAFVWSLSKRLNEEHI